MEKLHAIDIIEKRRELWEHYHDIEKDNEFVDRVSEHLIDPDNEYIRLELVRNPEYLIEMVFLIVDKDEDTVPFFLNSVQREFVAILSKAKEDFSAGKRSHMNFLVLKGRQQGFTSVITAYQLSCAMIMKNFTGFTIADNADNTHTIFEDKAKYPYNHLPTELKPTEKYNNRQELHFDKLNSRWRISTAGNKEVGRSKTIRFFHGSEAAFWDSISKVMTGLGQSLTKKSIKILESTANGFNEFQAMWSEAEEGENNWTPLFFEWWKTPEYRLEFTSKQQRADFIAAVEKAKDQKGIYGKINWLMGYAVLDWEQAFWYYDKYKELKDMLPQEYPNTPEEAFIATGSMIFDTEKLTRRKAELKKLYDLNPPIRGRVSYVYDEELQIILTDSIRFIECENGEVWVYEKPIPGYPYALGGDIAEGGADFSSGIVINNITGNEAAVFHGHLDTDIYAKVMFALGWLYNKALIGIEVNYDKHPTKELQRLKYPNLYYRESIDSVTKEKLPKYGFLTSSNSRPILVDKLIEVVRDNIETVNHLQEIEEMLVFVRNDVGKPCAMEGKHDDLVLGRGVAEMIRGQQSVRVTEAKEEIVGVYHWNELIMMGWSPWKIKTRLKRAKMVTVMEQQPSGRIVPVDKPDFVVIGMSNKK